MDNLFAGLGSRGEPRALDVLCETEVSSRELAASSGLQIAVVQKALSNLTSECLKKIGNQGPERRYVLSEEGIKKFREEADKILAEKRSPKVPKVS